MTATEAKVTNSPLIDQAEEFLTRYYPEGSEVHAVFRPLIDGARAGDIPENVRSAATELQNKDPRSTMSLLIQRILHGGKDKIDRWDLQRWIAATDSEKGPSNVTQKAFIAGYDVAPGAYTMTLGDKDYRLILERTAEGYSAHVAGIPECATLAPSADEALGKTHAKLLAHLDNDKLG
jgi:hypothetical protein